MSGEAIVALGIRVVGILLVFYQLEILSIGILAIRQEVPPSYQIYLLFSGVLFVAGVLMLILPVRISRLVLTGIESGQSEGTLSFRDLQYVVFGGIGAYLLSKSMIDIVGYVVQFVASNGQFAARLSDLVLLVVKILIGFWFLFGARGLLGLMRKVRNSGLQ